MDWSKSRHSGSGDCCENYSYFDSCGHGLARYGSLSSLLTLLKRNFAITDSLLLLCKIPVIKPPAILGRLQVTNLFERLVTFPPTRKNLHFVYRLWHKAASAKEVGLFF
jgi:hypothetical protein